MAQKAKGWNENDVNKAKGSCPVDVLLYWRVSEDELPSRGMYAY